MNFHHTKFVSGARKQNKISREIYIRGKMCALQRGHIFSPMDDFEKDFRKLIQIFTELNRVTYRKHHGIMSDADEAFLQKNAISEVAITIAESVYESVAREE